MAAGQQYKKLIVNLCYRYDQFKNSYEKYLSNDPASAKQKVFLDFTGLLEDKEEYKGYVIKPSQLDPNLSVRKISVERFVTYTAGLSDHRFKEGKHIRDYCIYGLPVYWISDIAEKHPLHHLLFNVFYVDGLLQDLVKGRSLDEVAFIIPPDRFYYHGGLITYFSEKYANLKFSCSQSTIYLPNGRQIISFVRQNFKDHNFFIKKKNHLKNELEWQNEKGKNLILTFLGSTWLPEKKIDFVLNGISKITGDNANYIPLIYDWNDLDKWNDKWSKLYFDSIPGRLKYAGFLMKFFSTFRKVNRVTNDATLINNGPVTSYILKMELINALTYKFFMLKSFIWLKNYFSNVEHCNVFYQDEYYCFGRIISKAITNTTNQSIGFQHGVIREDHTVYALNAVELEGKDPMPSPDHFVVWGSYFKDLICKRAPSLAGKVLVAANPNLFDREINKADHAIPVMKKETDILWCTGLYSELIEEIELMKGLVQKSDLKMVIRMHPIHDLREQITDVFNSTGYKNFGFSAEAELKKDILRSDIIICNSASTIVLEAMALNKRVVALNLGRYIPISIDHPNYSEVGTREDLIAVLQNNFLNTLNDKVAFTDSLLSREFKPWEEILI